MDNLDWNEVIGFKEGVVIVTFKVMIRGEPRVGGSGNLNQWG